MGCSAVSPFSTAPPPPHSFLSSLWTSGWEKLPAPAHPWTPQQPVLVPRAPLANLRVASDHTACSGTLGHCRPLPTGPHPYSGNHDNGPNSEPQNPHSRPPTTGRDPASRTLLFILSPVPWWLWCLSGGALNDSHPSCSLPDLPANPPFSPLTGFGMIWGGSWQQGSTAAAKLPKRFILRFMQNSLCGDQGWVAL